MKILDWFKKAATRFHICASEVLVSVYSGKKALAEDKLADEFSGLSIRVRKHSPQLFLEASNENTA